MRKRKTAGTKAAGTKTAGTKIAAKITEKDCFKKHNRVRVRPGVSSLL